MIKREARGRGLVPLARRLPDLPFIRFPDIWGDEDLLLVEEYREDGSLVIRADLPGIDPEKDVEIEVEDGMLRVSAERHQEEKVEEKNYVRTELRYGSFTRTLSLPEGASDKDVVATYKDGVLEIRVPLAPPAPAEVKKVPVSRR